MCKDEGAFRLPLIREIAGIGVRAAIVGGVQVGVMSWVGLSVYLQGPTSTILQQVLK
jgi:hypothetical protein